MLIQLRIKLADSPFDIWYLFETDKTFAGTTKSDCINENCFADDSVQLLKISIAVGIFSLKEKRDSHFQRYCGRENAVF